MTIKELADKVFSMTSDRYVSVEVTLDRHVHSRTKKHVEIEYRIYDSQFQRGFHGATPEEALVKYEAMFKPETSGMDTLVDISHEQLTGGNDE